MVGDAYVYDKINNMASKSKIEVAWFFCYVFIF